MRQNSLPCRPSASLRLTMKAGRFRSLHASDAQGGTGWLDSELVLMFVDQLDDFVEGRSRSTANWPRVFSGRADGAGSEKHERSAGDEMGDLAVRVAAGLAVGSRPCGQLAHRRMGVHWHQPDGVTGRRGCPCRLLSQALAVDRAARLRTHRCRTDGSVYGVACNECTGRFCH